MTKNDTGTLCVRFIPDINDAYPLSVIIVDDDKDQIYLQIRPDDIDSLLACLRNPMSLDVRLVTMTGDYNVGWWDRTEVSITNRGTLKVILLHWKKALELCTMIRQEMSCESDPLVGANRRRDENLNSVFG